MKDQIDIAARSKAVRRELEVKLGVKSHDLDHALRRAGRRLPRRIRARGEVLVQAEKLAGNPKLARQMDGPAISAAYERVNAHLRAIDVADRRKGRLLSLAATMAGNMLIVVVGFIAWLWWRGYV